MSEGETSILTRCSYQEAVSTLHCRLENGSDLHVNERQKILLLRAARPKLHYYSDVIHLLDWKLTVEHDGGV